MASMYLDRDLAIEIPLAERFQALDD